MTIMRPRSGDRVYRAPGLTPSAIDRTMPEIAGTYRTRDGLRMNEERTQAPAETPGDREPKVIKRYTNRKLYDTVESRYVTLDEIAAMIKAGAEVKIIDNRTKEDLTSVTL